MGLLLDTQRTTAERHSVDAHPPTPPDSNRLADGCREQVWLPPNRKKGLSFEVTVIFTLILFKEEEK